MREHSTTISGVLSAESDITLPPKLKHEFLAGLGPSSPRLGPSWQGALDRVLKVHKMGTH